VCGLRVGGVVWACGQLEVVRSKGENLGARTRGHLASWRFVCVRVGKEKIDFCCKMYKITGIHGGGRKVARTGE